MCNQIIPQDNSTFSNIDEVITNHIHWDFSVNFQEQKLKGYANLTLTPLNKDLKVLYLDTSYLNIFKCTTNNGVKELKFKLYPRDENFGSKLEIDLGELDIGSQLEIKVEYETTPESTALQWLEPSQTLGGKHPYLFSQCQAIHARSMLPCQDTPQIKITYSASVQVPSQLTALMSAIGTGSDINNDKEFKTYKFDQKIGIPSYLIALVVGNLESKSISDQIAVWSEPDMVDSAAWEFQDTTKFLTIAESLVGKYVWGRYDLLILPPSFPYGGMENPCLSFVTPTLLAGDRSAVGVVAHELAHSWTGNLVTNSNWTHFWLNEGWTKFLERKIMGRLHGEQTRQFGAILGYKSLQNSVNSFGKDSPLTALCPDLSTTNPDDAFSTVPYEKGFSILYYLEQLLGGADIFEPYMMEYIQNFAHKTVTTQQWKDHLYEYFKREHSDENIKLLDSVDWNTWFFAPGMPIVKNNYDNTLGEICDNLSQRWDAARHNKEFSEFKLEEYENLTIDQKVVFMERLTELEAFPHNVISALENIYNLGEVKNCEVKYRWQIVALIANYEPIYPKVAEFLVQQGRMKYVRPLYKKLNNAKNGSQLAKDTFLKHKNFYHPIAAKLIEK
ncbi:leukotriene A-4 hydrol, partial [Conidiobolus coronatus NRRL 28638]